jgi:uncharacterized protein GlcG (DUF336 family)
MKKAVFTGLSVAAVALFGASAASATSLSVVCPVTHGNLVTQLKAAAGADSTGLNNNYWAVVVNRDGVVCDVAYSGATVYDQWLLSRQIASAKAFTALGLSLNGAAVSSGALYAWVQSGAKANYLAGFPGFAPPNPLFGLEGGNVQNSSVVYQGDISLWGKNDGTVEGSDPLIGKRVGGTITFGGGLGLYGYSGNNKLVGGLGLSGDTACADHSTAWRTRSNLSLAPGSSVNTGFDPIKLTTDTSGHPHCPNDAGTQGTTP